MERGKSFADIVAEAKAQPSSDSSDVSTYAPFRDQNGHELSKVSGLSPSEARARVLEGAQLAFEDCGCGGASGGCDTIWIDEQTREHIASGSSPRLSKGKRSLSWMDLWEGAGGFVVYAHGSVKWGDALS